MTATQNKEIQDTVRKERKRLLDFIRQRVKSEEDAEDILQDVFYQFVNTYRMMEPIEKVTAWLFTVARNKITDLYRKKKANTFSSLIPVSANEDGDETYSNYFLDEIIQDHSDSPESQYMRSLIWDTLNASLDTLPSEQKEVFVLHELEGKSFKDIAAQTGTPVNTLLSRKRYAVLHLRERLQILYNELINL
ncbi:MAG: sigma-70 family RNA polymerase sigma factor [Chitinophagales bacterium]|nr:sigma-70 family RNA polymerase sigma factor [Chitinophagales bacterium]